MKKNKHLIAIVGPTASGKTAFSVELAKKLNCAILSADSRQFFKELNIGTAKPSLKEMKNVKHYFIDSHSIQEEYTSGQYEQDALLILEQEFETNDFVLIVGGSGLYIDALCKGIDDLPRDEAIRKQLNEEFSLFGLNKLRAELQAKDAAYYATIDNQNPHRIIRALEVIRKSGGKMNDFLKNKSKKRDFEIHYFGIHHERERLYERINQRVVKMIEDGLIDEVSNVMPFRHKQALKTVGYKEVFDFLDGKTEQKEMTALIQQNTRRYAKRQITWFKREKSTIWMDVNDKSNWIDIVLTKFE